MQLVPASRLSRSKYEEAVADGLERAYGDAVDDTRQVDELKAVVLSDLHRGARDGADDFERCEPAYSAALGAYLEQGYELWLLGDVEELWENAVDEVMPCYAALLELEREFLAGPGLRRFWGNHDLDWSDSENARAHLSGVPMHEALRLRLLDGDRELGEMFLVHGHQGTDVNERFAWFSRFVLRRVWRPLQRSQGLLSTTPASSYDVRAKHDTAMCLWAQRRARRVVTIAGHTHHPIFPGTEAPGHADPARTAAAKKALDDARAGGADRDELTAKRADYELARGRDRPKPVRTTPNEPPSYFNTGCCCFPDGDVTALELSGGAIRLVRWLDNDGNAASQALTPPRPLRDLFG